MRTRVVVLGHDRSGDPAPSEAGVTAAPRSDVLLAAVAAEGDLARVLPGDGHVLVLSERRHARALGRQAAMLAARGDDVPIATRALPHGPLALRMLAEVVAEQDVPPAHAVAFLDAVAAQTFSAAWVPGVSGLTTPEPTLLQHLRSWLPVGAGFLVEHSPEARVRSVTAAAHGEQADGATDTGRGGVLLVGPGTAPDIAVRQAQRASGARERHAVPQDVVPGVPHERYGSARAVEFAALPDPLPRMPAVEEAPACPVCDVPVPQETCPFCHVLLAPLQLETRP